MKTAISVGTNILRVDITAADPALPAVSSLSRLATKISRLVGITATPIATPTMWSGHYRVHTFGKTAEQIIAEVNRIKIHHAAKCDRLNGFIDMVSKPLVIGNAPYTWIDCLLVERGGDVVLHAFLVDAVGARPKCMPFERVYGTIEQVPPNAVIAAMVQQAITDEISSNADHQATIARVQAALALTP